MIKMSTREGLRGGKTYSAPSLSVRTALQSPVSGSSTQQVTTSSSPSPPSPSLPTKTPSISSSSTSVPNSFRETASTLTPACIHTLTHSGPRTG